MSEGEEVRTLERHAQTGLTILVVGLLGWVGLTTQETQIKVAQLSIEIQQIQSHLGQPPNRLEDAIRRIERIENLMIEELDEHDRADARARRSLD